jgi:hypothetical protein
MLSLSQLMPPIPQTSKSLTANHATMVIEDPDEPGITHIMNVGQIEDLALPGSWSQEKDPPYKEVSISSLHQFVLEGDPTAHVCFFYRGHPLSQGGSQAFRTILSQSPHLLDIEERQEILEALRDKTPAQDFVYTSIKTIEIAPRTVLMVEGTFRKHGLRAASIYVDGAKNRDRAAVQELSFLAPKDSFYRNYGGIMHAFRNLSWID